VFCFPFQESSFEQLKTFSAAHKEKDSKGGEIPPKYRNLTPPILTK